LLLSPAAKVQESHGEAAPGREDTRQVRSARQTVPEYKKKRQKSRCGELTPGGHRPEAAGVAASGVTTARTSSSAEARLL